MIPIRRAALAALVLAVTAASAHAQGSAFTYQGRLRDNGAPASGGFDFRSILYDAPVGGSQVGPIQEREDVVVADGLFTLPLDFGPAAFAGARFAQRHRTVVEMDKRPEERGTYLHPEAWDQPPGKGLAARRGMDVKEE